MRTVPCVKGNLFPLLLILHLITLPYVSGKSFEECGVDFKNDIENDDRVAWSYRYNNTNPRGLLPGRKAPLMITYDGCRFYCGSSPKIYKWENIADTITTWILPIAGGLLLQAPFEANRRLSTLLALCRWLGSPVASLMYILWNIKISSRCALLVDMSVPYRARPGYQSTPIWSTLGALRRRAISGIQGEEVVDEIQTWPDIDSLSTPDEKSEARAFAEIRDSFYILSVLNQYEVRRGTSHNVKQVLHYAIFHRNPDMVISRRELATQIRRERRHGVVQVLVSILWFVFALIISIYKAFGQLGENSQAHNLALGLLMSWLPVLISCSLVDRNPVNSTRTRGQLQALLNQAQGAQNHTVAVDLGRFCGQARQKWHYGVAHTILLDVELTFNHRDRGLIRYYRNNSMANAHSDPEAPPLWSFDRAQLGQMISAMLIVGCATAGALVISYNTPTVGFGCRTLGNVVFGLVVAVCFMLECLGLALVDPEDPRHLRTISNCLRVFITTLEVLNTLFLFGILLAQTTGIYNTCLCRASKFGGHGGYSYFVEGVEVFRRDFAVAKYWITATVLGTLPLFVICYATYEWLTQSFLWAEDYNKAMRGLMRVRRFKKWFLRETFIALFHGVASLIWRYLFFSWTMDLRPVTWKRA
ncbi:MAG: hypothetical protein M1837_005408 [Sclerophora amabilis]|nr:MAG: hypothetical protein M1837_005408 [Sclerophora amabilis]